MSVRRLAEDSVQPASFRLHAGKCGLGGGHDQEISEGPRAIGGHPAADARAGTGWLGDQGGDREHRRHARHALYPRAGSRDLLHPVPAEAGRHPRPYPGLRHDALHAARRRRADRASASRRSIHEPFHPNESGTLSWEEVECLGACVNAPMVMIFKDTYEDLTPEQLDEIIDRFDAGKGDSVPPGPQIDRIYSAPVPGHLADRREGRAQTKQGRKAKAAKPAAPTTGRAPAAASRSAAVKGGQAEDACCRDQRGGEVPVAGQGGARPEKAASVEAPGFSGAKANLAVESDAGPAKQWMGKLGMLLRVKQKN